MSTTTQSRTSASDARRPPAHLLHVFSTFAVGGPQVRFCQIADALGDRYRHTVLAMDDNHDCRRHLAPRVDATFRTLGIEKRKVVGNLLRFHALLREIRPDLLVTYNWGAIEWAFVNRLRPVCRHVHIEDGFGPEEAEGQLRRRVYLRRLALGRTAAIVMPSLTLQRIATRIWGFGEGHIVYLPNGIDCDAFSQPPDPAILSGIDREPDDLLIGTVATLRPEKNIDRLLRVFARVLTGRPKTRLIIAGDGGEKERLLALTAEMGLSDRAHFLGHQAPDRLLGLLDIFAISSDTEQMPLSVLEAMAAALPVAGVDVGDVRSIVATDNQPYIVAKEDEAGLATALERLLDAPEVRRRLGQANRARALDDYAHSRMFDRYDALFSGTGAKN